MSVHGLLRFVSATVFAEAGIDGEEREKPLEWRRRFNPISFKAQDLAVSYAYTINEVEFSISDSEAASEESVTPKVVRKRRVNFKVDQETMRDRLYFAMADKESGLYRLEGVGGDIDVSIVEGEPVKEGAGGGEAGSYGGAAFRVDQDRKDERLSIEVTAPSSQFDEIVPLLHNGKVNTLHMTVDLQCFSFEVDDALREWYHPRDLFLHPDFVRASLRSMVWSLTEEQRAGMAAEAAPEEEEAVSAEQVVPVRPAPDYSTLLRGIRSALWVIAGVLLLGLLSGR